MSKKYLLIISALVFIVVQSVAKPMIDGLFSKPIIHSVVVKKEEIKGEMLNFL